MLNYLIYISPLGTFIATVLWFLVGLPASIGAYYQSWKTRQEAKAAREGLLHSMDCLEFVAADGTCVNLVPL